MGSRFQKTIGWFTSREEEEDDLLKEEDVWLWSKAKEKHYGGEFSFAVVQASQNLETFGQVETATNIVFFGVYDGHGGGADASQYITENLFTHLIRLIQEQYPVSKELLRDAVNATEKGFMDVVRSSYRRNPKIVKMGSCCLVGIIWGGVLHLANLGDSLAVLCRSEGNKLIAVQLNKSHNLRNEEIREEVQQLQPNDDTLVVRRNNGWTIKGILKVSKSIGDADLKMPPSSSEDGFPVEHVPLPFNQALVSAEPDLYVRALETSDRFLIIASKGLWEFLTMDEAVHIVNTNPRSGIAHRLINRAQKVTCSKWGITYEELTNIPGGDSREEKRLRFHENMSVIVVFLDHPCSDRADVPHLSIKPFVDPVQSGFTEVQSLI